MQAAAEGRGRLRASHADREYVIDRLKAAFVQGRLTKDELDMRLGQAFESRTHPELAALTADIPAERADAEGTSQLPAAHLDPEHGPSGGPLSRSRRMLVVAAAVMAVTGLVLGLWLGSGSSPSGLGLGSRPSGPGLGGRGYYPDAVAFSPSGKILVTADADGTARLWDVATGRQIGAPIKVSGARVLWVAVSPDGKIVATADSDGTVRLWDVATGRQAGPPFKVSSVRVLGVAFSPDGKILATAGIGGSARLWDVATRGQIGAAMTPGGGPVLAVAFSPDGKILATTDSDFTARLWNVTTQHQTGKPIAGALSVAFSPDGKILATTGTGFANIRLWDVKTHRRIGTAMSAGRTDPYGLAFSPDGKTLVTTDTDGTIRLWNVTTHRQIGALTAPKGAPEFLRGPEFLLAALSPDGKILATTRFAGPAQFWDLSTIRHA